MVIGRENGHLECYDTGNLGTVVWWNHEDRDGLLAVEALAISPDGAWLASSILQTKPSESEFPRTECEITLRTLARGDQLQPVHTSRGIVRALAFSPDAAGRFLAIGGGASHEIVVKDRQPGPGRDAPQIAMRGPGTTLWDVGFVVDVDAASKPTVAYARNRPIGPEPTVWEAFDFPRRFIVPVDQPERLSRAIKTFQGWSIAVESPFRLVAASAGERPVPIALSPSTDRRWSSYTFIPPDRASGHEKLTVAVGCEGGHVLIHSLPDGARTRVLAGHVDAVYAMAPSPDGRWLATASADQTIRLWSLAGCDTRAPLGAVFERDAQGNWIVNRVSTRGFADQMGLKVNDRVKKVEQKKTDDLGRAARTPLALDRLDAEIQAIAPDLSSSIVFEVTRPGGPNLPPLSTFRLDRSALNLLPGSDREWIVWMPESYYDTSIAGDSRLLGWHVNKVDAS